MKRTFVLTSLLAFAALSPNDSGYGASPSPDAAGLCVPVRGSFCGEKVPESPDPLVAYRWERPLASDNLEHYELHPLSIEMRTASGKTRSIRPGRPIRIDEPCTLMLDFGQVNAGWLAFDSDDLAGEVEMSISEYTEPAVLNAGAQHPVKTAAAERQDGNTYLLRLNDELYEGVRYGWIHVRSADRPFTISAIRLTCQIKPTNYEGSFACNDPSLTRIWYTGAYTVKLNLLKDYFGAILMERSDRHSWTGDAHPSQAASMVAFGNYDFVKQNLFYTSTQFNGIAGYSLYWILCLVDYFDYTGDRQTFDRLKENACNKLDIAYEHYGKSPDLQFFGWDERLGAGFENPNCPESQNAYKMLSLRAWNEFSRAAGAAGYADIAEKYAAYVEQKSRELREHPDPFGSFGLFAASDAVNAGFTTPAEQQRLWQNAFSDRQQRLSYSPFNQYFVIQAMARMGRHAEALTTIDDCWGGQLRYGGTTFFEVYRPSWNESLAPNGAPVNNQCGYTSLTHPWSAGVTKWLSEEILGIRPLSPGFGSFLAAPHLTPDVHSVRGSVPTPHGTVRYSFDLKTGRGRLVVPDGTCATVGIPKSGRTVRSVLLGKRPAEQASDKRTEDSLFVYYHGIRPGEYEIRAAYSGKLRRPRKEPFLYACPQPAVQDSTTRGDWPGRYGSKGYVFCLYEPDGSHRIRLPEFTDSIRFAKTGGLHIATRTDDRRAPVSEDGSGTRSAGAVVTLDPAPCNQTMTVDIRNKHDGPYRLALYFVDWEKTGRRSAVEVFDLDDKRLLMPVQIVRDYREGRYVVLSLEGSVRLRINQVRGTNASLCALFFD